MKHRATLALYAFVLLNLAAAAVLQIIAPWIPAAVRCASEWLCSLAEPIGTALMLMASGTQAEWLQSAYHAYYGVHGSLVVALLLLALCAVRARGLWRSRGASLPPQFAGFPLGVAAFGAVIYVLDMSIYVVVPYPLLSPPRVYGAICMLLGLLLTEGSGVLARRRGAPAPVPFAGPGSDEQPALRPPRRRPLWTVTAVSSPAVGVLLTLLIIVTLGRGQGYAGLAAMALGIVAIGASLAVGAVATLVAVARRERWPALQVLAFLVNFGVGVPLLLKAL